MAEFRKRCINFEETGNIVDKKHAPDPPGYDLVAARDSGTVAVGSVKSKELLARKQQALYSQATGHFKTIGFMAFMMWMSGNSLHLFSIMTTASGIYQPIMAIVNVTQAFPTSASEEGKLDIWQPRILYCLINGLGLLWAAYKVNSMGLLPTSLSDYASLFPSPVLSEVSMTSVL